jgi:threonine dehydrogenase-like Zn-dependent dehydrogenase
VLELLRQGRLEADGLITTRVPADEAPSMYPALMNHPEDHLGVIIQWDDAP